MNNANTTPQSNPEEPTKTINGPISAEFRIGQTELTDEETIEGKRYFSWIITPADLEVGAIAGWSELLQGIDESGFGHLEIPQETRSATSVLSGKEAWQDEKLDILMRALCYLQEVENRFGLIDVSLNFDTVGVTTEKNRRVLMMPPHEFVSQKDNPDKIVEWRSKLVNDLSDILIVDPNRERLSDNFAEAINQITGGERP